MRDKRNILNIFYLVGSLISILWYYWLADVVVLLFAQNCNCFKSLPDYNWLKLIIYLAPPIVFTFIPRILKYIYRSMYGSGTKQVKELIFDLLNAFAILVNFNVLTILINQVVKEKYAFDFASVMLLINTLGLYVYIFHVTIRRFLEYSYLKILGIAIFTIFLGWFSFQEISLIAILSIILNTVISIDQRKCLFLFLEKKEIEFQCLRKMSSKEDLTDDELTGKFLAQKIALYGLIAVFYVIIKITDSLIITPLLYYHFISSQSIEFPEFIIFFFKGFERLLWLFAVLLFIYLKKKWRDNLDKIF